MSMNPVVHFEMPAEDQKRMAEFYTKAFGWQTQQMGPEMGNYVLVTTSEMEGKLPKEPGRINGGFFTRTKPDQAPSVVISVEDIRQAMKRVADAGGTVIGGSKADGEPDEIPGVGIFCSFKDSEGNRISMIQPLPMA